MIKINRISLYVGIPLLAMAIVVSVFVIAASGSAVVSRYFELLSSLVNIMVAAAIIVLFSINLLVVKRLDDAFNQLGKAINSAAKRPVQQRPPPPPLAPPRQYPPPLAPPRQYPPPPPPPPQYQPQQAPPSQSLPPQQPQPQDEYPEDSEDEGQ
ncbi:hypothetical protein GCM10007981_05420 [Thermocladium modestius]|uniref:Uncharacterized protein n=1 Tax=Thermocladium modestius TaxID=62609 RepID=A0A830GS01_9CREN|nr:hypothetical protein GCM10007981_05420 [Thermocladium modestius]